MRSTLTLLSPSALSVFVLLLSGCFEDPSVSNTAGSGGSETAGDGDGDGDEGTETSDSQGDGDPTTGDGDGDPTTGDGDGDPTTGDGDGDPEPCSEGPYAVSYTGPIMFAAGANPQGVALGDLDGDDDLDIIAASRDDHELNVYLGTGTGNFNGPMPTMVGTNWFPQQVHAAAIADGIVDVVFDAYDSNAMGPVLIRLRGDGSGGFYDFESLPVSSSRFTLGELDADAAVDIASPSGADMVVYPASVGQESYSALDFIKSQSPTASIDAIGTGDFDMDGDLDVAVAAFGTVYIGTNDGAGQFSFAAPLAFFGVPTGIASGDVTGDGFPDLLLTTFGGGSDAGHLFVGDGDGTFQADVVLPAPSSPTALDVADIDRDGVDDLAMVGLGQIAVYLSNGDGSFGPAEQITCMGLNPRQLHIGDLNGDCVGDVVTVTDQGVCVMMSE